MKKMIYFIGFAILIIAALLFYASKARGQYKISAEEFQRKLKETSKPQLVDVRTPSEFGAGHLKGARNINYYDNSFRAKAAKLDKEKPVFVYCKSGGRSGSAVGILRKMGFETVYDLRGGILQWQASRKAIVK